jgi:soluble lytic murein transglycosylase-like protein
MTISPVEIPSVAESLRWTLPVSRTPWPDPMIDGWSPSLNDDVTSSGAPPAGSAPAAKPSPNGQPATSLSQLIAQLSRQLRTIERTFMSALRDLARNAQNSVASDAPQAAPASAAQTKPQKGVSPYDGLIRRTAAKHDLDPALLSAVIRQESGFDANARSSAGAMGLMQLMPGTAKSLGVTDAFDPAQNVEGGARLLRGLIDQYAGRLDLALAAYNAGPGAVDKYHGVPPYAETRGYVRAILDDYRATALRA